MNDIEILAPVGSIEALYAATENGANAVYLGGKLFNARQYASNFDRNELKKAVEYAHIRDVKVYVVVNILLSDKELKDAIEYITYLYNIDVDAIIIQDLGLASIVKEILPDLDIHASTQMTINNFMGVKFLEELGFQRVVLARELSLKEIDYIKKNTDIELEGFIHGALCVSYSGQCLMSSILGGRSGNRGRCAQPCRMPYTLVDMETGKTISKELEEKYLLSPKDLNTIDYLYDIISSGIISLKIEGRMKRPEYVATIINNYRRTLDRVIKEKKSVDVSEKVKKDIKQAFNRGFTKGYILGDYGRNMISIDKPNNKGIYLGTIVKKDNKFMYLKLEDSLNKGDGIEVIYSNKKSKGMIVNKIYKKNKLVDTANKGDLVKLNKLKGVNSNSIVYKTSDVKLLEKAKNSFTQESEKKKIKIYMALNIEINNPIILHIWDDKGNYVEVISKELVEKARKVSLNKEKVKKQMEKLGGTPYYIDSININLEENAMVSYSVLNKIRRKGISELNKKRGILNNRIEVNREDMIIKTEKALDFPGNKIKDEDKRISIKVTNFEQFSKLNIDKLDRLYLNFTEGLSECIQEVKNKNKEVYFSTNRILENKDFNKLEATFRNIDLSQIDGISVSNVGTLKFIKDKYDVKIHCDEGLNIFNSKTVKFLKDYGVGSVTLSPELKLNQISDITSKNKIKYEAIGYGYLPLMITKYCPLSLIKGCDSNNYCDKCQLKELYGLRDRKGMVFPFNRKGKTTLIYNSQPLMVLEHLDSVYNEGVNIIRLDFTIEKNNIKDIQNIFFDYINNLVSMKEVKEFVSNYKQDTSITKGHYFRGVI
ncbi:Protease [Caldisalinibacter kiritimatiensis]|uniref:Protease n=1 Tax=Caldisalinibacter kiritimatiensis TaxID=1304284 RepID=R1AWC6_9FIRM|nr:U32 family peptidase [Caldisalinibacter kiritimatiensis]EOD00927.1 Protease [Caldisalinibacter kiritimatiensis]